MYGIILLHIFFLLSKLLLIFERICWTQVKSVLFVLLCSCFFSSCPYFRKILWYIYFFSRVCNKISEIFGRTMITCVYLLSKTKVIYLQLLILQSGFIRFFLGILVEYVLFIFFLSYVFYETLSCKQITFSTNNTSIQTGKIISEICGPVLCLIV